MATEYENVADCPKREVGSRVYSKSIGGRKYPPEALQGWVLNKLRLDAERVAGEFEQAVITVPAYFDEVRRKSTQEAGYIAGLDVQDIINEPTAAAIAFGQQGGWLSASESGDKGEIRVLVYDLGGGTFDVTIMKIRRNEFVTTVTDGDMRLGGRDWDERLVNHVAGQFAGQYGIDPRNNDECLGQLLRDCKEAKETLSVRSQATIHCNCMGNSLRVPVTRQEFEKLTIDLVDRSEFTVPRSAQGGPYEIHGRRSRASGRRFHSHASGSEHAERIDGKGTGRLPSRRMKRFLMERQFGRQFCMVTNRGAGFPQQKLLT